LDPKGLFRALVLPVGEAVLGVGVRAGKGSSGFTTRGWGFSEARERARQ